MAANRPNAMNLPTLCSDGMSNHDLYKVWNGMLQRCYNPKAFRYYRYGGRGISVHLAWHSLKAFVEQVGPRPNKDMQLDRINNDGNYEPGNVRWATKSQNILNRDVTQLVEYKGKMTPISEVAKETGINRTTIRYRIKRGEDDIFRPVVPRKKNGVVSADHGRESDESLPTWTVVRLADRTWTTGGTPNDPAYAGLEVFQIKAERREQALKIAQNHRSRVKRKKEKEQSHV